MRTFNIEGPVIPARHCCIPPLERLNLDEILELIRRVIEPLLSGAGEPAFTAPISNTSAIRGGSPETIRRSRCGACSRRAAAMVGARAG